MNHGMARQRCIRECVGKKVYYLKWAPFGVHFGSQFGTHTSYFVCGGAPPPGRNPPPPPPLSTDWFGKLHPPKAWQRAGVNTPHTIFLFKYIRALDVWVSEWVFVALPPVHPMMPGWSGRLLCCWSRWPRGRGVTPPSPPSNLIPLFLRLVLTASFPSLLLGLFTGNPCSLRLSHSLSL